MMFDNKRVILSTMKKINKDNIKVILAEPQLSENIGMTARAMLNFGLHQLYLINPKQDHLSKKSINASAGAEKVLRNAKVFNNLEDSISSLNHLFACTVRARDMIKPTCGPEELYNKINILDNKSNIGILFGREKSGLSNFQISFADTIVEIPTSPEFSSLNLAQAVIIIASEINRINVNYSKRTMLMSDTVPAKKREIIGFFEHLERALEDSGFLKPLEKKPTMMINIRNIFSRSILTEQDIKTLRGVITSLLSWPDGYQDNKKLKKIKIIADGTDKK